MHKACTGVALTFYLAQNDNRGTKEHQQNAKDGDPNCRGKGLWSQPPDRQKANRTHHTKRDDQSRHAALCLVRQLWSLKPLTIG